MVRVCPTGPTFGTPLVRLGEVGSTNDIARAMAAGGVAEGAVVVADRQTRGRGRLGRVWISPPGGLWCSILLPPAPSSASGLLSLAIGVAAAEAIEAAAGVEPAIRWPNDVMLGDRKVCGILLEGVGRLVIAGIGINLNVALDLMPAEVAAGATSLHVVVGRQVDREVMLGELLNRCSRWHQAWSSGCSGIAEAWRRRDAAFGRDITVSIPGETVRGVAEGIDDGGALRLRLPCGEVRRLVAGDLMTEATVPAS